MEQPGWARECTDSKRVNNFFFFGFKTMLFLKGTSRITKTFKPILPVFLQQPKTLKFVMGVTPHALLPVDRKQQHLTF